MIWRYQGNSKPLFSPGGWTEGEGGTHGGSTRTLRLSKPFDSWRPNPGDEGEHRERRVCCPKFQYSVRRRLVTEQYGVLERFFECGAFKHPYPQKNLPGSGTPGSKFSRGRPPRCGPPAHSTVRTSFPIRSDLGDVKRRSNHQTKLVLRIYILYSDFFEKKK